MANRRISLDLQYDIAKRIRWSNQTDLGKMFGISSIAVGKELITFGLKDAVTKAPTEKALLEGYALSTPLKDGTPYFMWDRQRVKGLLGEKHQRLTPVEKWANEVLVVYRSAEAASKRGEDKLGRLMVDTAFENVPKDLLAAVEAMVNALQ